MIPLLLDIAQPLPAAEKTVFALRGLLLVGGGVLAVIGLSAIAVVLILLARKKKK